MVLEVLLGALAHGADPRPITWDEATRNLVVFFVTIFIALSLSYPVLAPLFPKRSADGEQPAEAAEANSGLVGWLAVGLLLVLSMGWWLTRTSFVELNAEATPVAHDRHTQERGGQVAMWGDFHAEVARIESGEVRVYLTDEYNRPIAARYFDAEISPASEALGASLPTVSAGEATAGATATPVPSQEAAAADGWTPQDSGEESPSPVMEPHPTTPALDDSYRFARMDRADKSYRVKVSTPGWSVGLKFTFDDSNGRRSLPIWCGTR